MMKFILLKQYKGHAPGEIVDCDRKVGQWLLRHNRGELVDESESATIKEDKLNGNGDEEFDT